MNVKFEGGKELEKQLLKLKTATAKRVTRKVMKRVMEPVREKAESLAPEAEGDLKEAVSISSRARKRRQPAGTIEIHMGVETSQGQVGTQQEFGNIQQAAQPFMRPAWEPMKYTVLENFGEQMMVEVLKSVARAEKRAAKG